MTQAASTENVSLLRLVVGKARGPHWRGPDWKQSIQWLAEGGVEHPRQGGCE